MKTIFGLAFLCLALFVLINTDINPQRPVVDLPEEISEAKQGDLLQVERVTTDSLFLGFARNRTEYQIELIDQDNVKIDNGVEFRVIPFDSIQTYIQNDNL